MAMFVRCEGRSYEFVHYNPNVEERSPDAVEFFTRFHSTSIIRGYNDPEGNYVGNCTYTTWCELIDFFHGRMDPFMRILLSYNREKGYCLAAENDSSKINRVKKNGDKKKINCKPVRKRTELERLQDVNLLPPKRIRKLVLRI